MEIYNIGKIETIKIYVKIHKKEYKNLIDAVDLGWILKLRKINSAV